MIKISANKENINNIIDVLDKKLIQAYVDLRAVLYLLDVITEGKIKFVKIEHTKKEVGK